MSNGVKTILYVLLGICTLVFGALAYNNIKRAIAVKDAAALKSIDQAADTGSSTTQAELHPEPTAATNSPSGTNDLASATNNAATNAGLAALNQVLASTTADAALTNLPAMATKPGTTNETATLSATKPPAKAAKSKSKVRKIVRRDADGNEVLSAPKHMGLYIGLLILSALGLGTLIAYDVSQFTGDRALKIVYNDNLEGIKDPEYDEAEAEWANGNHLEAIRMMRGYLNKNPREQHVALRIAEIYEKDLNNFLAAALEYQEVLKKKLAPERWGWAAIHLCNLYFKLSQDDKAVALLQRIDLEYGQTAAAEKARKRLEQMNIPTSVDAAAAEEAASAAETLPEPEAKGPKLPPGFTLKKR